MNERDRSRLAALRLQIAQRQLERGQYQEVLDALHQAESPEERDLAALCHYHLMKQVCAEGKLTEAHEHAAQAVRSRSRVVRFLTDQRLKLLRGPAGPNARPSQIYKPGVVHLDGLHEVPVLGEYVSRGAAGGLNQVILLLKKAPEEMEAAEQAARPEVIRQLGASLCGLLMRMEWLRLVDFVVPIPPDFDRYSTRGYSPPDAIAQEFSAASRIPVVPGALIKTRATEDLRRVSWYEREAIIAGSLGVAAEREFVIPGSVVLIVDDVVTYGTHFREASRLLQASGAAEVYAAAIATARENLISFD